MQADPRRILIVAQLPTQDLAMLDAVQGGIDKIQSDPAAIESDPLDEASQLAKDYGLQQCGSG